MPKSLSLTELIPVPMKAAGRSVLAPPGSHRSSGITLLRSLLGTSLASLWPEASRQSRNAAHSQLAGSRSFANPVVLEETDGLQPSAVAERVSAELLQSQSSLL